MLVDNGLTNIFLLNTCSKQPTLRKLQILFIHLIAPLLYPDLEIHFKTSKRPIHDIKVGKRRN